MSLGPIMLDLDSVEMSPEERELLQNPLVGGVILFTRNFSSVEQITQLIKEIHQLREPRLLVAVDHEAEEFNGFVMDFLPCLQWDILVRSINIILNEHIYCLKQPAG